MIEYETFRDEAVDDEYITMGSDVISAIHRSYHHGPYNIQYFSGRRYGKQ
jgi:hypothetical protein